MANLVIFRQMQVCRLSDAKFCEQICPSRWLDEVYSSTTFTGFSWRRYV